MSSPLLTRIEIPFFLALRHKADADYPEDPGYVRPEGRPVPYPPALMEGSEEPFTNPLVRQICAAWAIRFLNESLKHYWRFPEAPMWTFSYVEDAWETQCDEYLWLGMNVTSTWLDPTDHLRRYLDAVLKVLGEKTITFAPAESRLKLSFMPREGPFTLHRLKGIASMLWVTDPLLSKLRPPHCGPNSQHSVGFQYTNLFREHHPVSLQSEMGSGFLVDDPWSNRLSWHRRPLKVMPHPGELSEGKYRTGLDKIYGAKSIPELLHLLNLPAQEVDARYKFQAAYDFRKATDAMHPRIELSQHCGTLHGPAIMDWAAICRFITDPPLPPPNRSLIAESRVLRQRIEKGLTIFDCLKSGGLRKMKYYKLRNEPFQVPDIAKWPVRTRPILKYDQAPGPPRLYVTLDDVEMETLNWVRYTKNSKGTRNSTYSFGVELEILIPMSKYPKTYLDRGGINSYQTTVEEVGDLFSCTSSEVNARSIRDTSSEEGQDSDQETERGNEDTVTMMGVDIDALQERTAAQEGMAVENGGMDYDSSSSEDEDPDPTDPRDIARGTFFAVRSHYIANVISSLGHLAYFIRTENFPQNRAWKRELANRGLLHVPGVNLQYHAWSVVPDGSLPEVYNWKGYYGLTGMELVSPISQDVPECWEGVLEVVGGLSRNLRVRVNSDCGLHVHVGKGEQLMPLHLLRKVFCLMSCVEEIVFSLCDPCRKNSMFSYGLLKNNSRLLREFEERPMPPHAVHMDLKRHFPEEIVKRRPLWALVRNMWTERYLSELRHRNYKAALSMATCKAHNANGISVSDLEADVYAKGTVEFRYMEGTVDPGLVLRWAQFTIALFQFADVARPEAWRALIRTALKCEDAMEYDLDILGDFLQQLGLGEDFPYWKERVSRFRAEMGFDDDNTDGEFIVDPPETPGEKFVPAVSDEQMEALRRDICQRERMTPFAAEE